jgi:3-hydroxyanthranilate 3,4-dioxygenase
MTPSLATSSPEPAVRQPLGHTGFDGAGKVESPLDLFQWIAENRHRLKPPVSNGYLYDGKDFFIMIIAGPNARNDFHLTRSEEFFYQLKGDIVVRIFEDGRIKDVVVREGETFFAPGGVPHSPTRPPDTLGLVVERRRPPDEMEHIIWYCDQCETLVEDLEFSCKDIVEHFAQAMEDFWADPKRATCKNCGHRVAKPNPIKRIVFEPTVVIEREP